MDVERLVVMNNIVTPRRRRKQSRLISDCPPKSTWLAPMTGPVGRPLISGDASGHSGPRELIARRDIGKLVPIASRAGSADTSRLSRACVSVSRHPPASRCRVTADPRGGVRVRPLRDAHCFGARRRFVGGAVRSLLHSRRRALATGLSDTHPHLPPAARRLGVGEAQLHPRWDRPVSTADQARMPTGPRLTRPVMSARLLAVGLVLEWIRHSSIAGTNRCSPDRFCRAGST